MKSPLEKSLLVVSYNLWWNGCLRTTFFQRTARQTIFCICIVVGIGCCRAMGQSGFGVICGETANTVYCYGQPFFRQIEQGLSISEAVMQAHLISDTLWAEICEHDTYDAYGIQTSDTTSAGLYQTKSYTHLVHNQHDSVFVHYLTIHPSYHQIDTLLLFADNMQGYVAGENSYSGFSQSGCDSSINIMVYAITCAPTYNVTAEYGIDEIPIDSLPEPQIVPSSSNLRIVRSRSAIFRVGATEQVVWYIINREDSLRCIQNVQIGFPPCGGDFTATDGDRNVYQTIRIGGNCWLRKNLYARHYAQNGEMIPVATISISEALPDTLSNLQNFGRMYSWYSAIGIPENSVAYPPTNSAGEIQGACPNGWHIPTMTELLTLNCFHAISLKNNTLWIGNCDNRSCFSASPAGYYNSVRDRYEYILTHTRLWSCEAHNDISAHYASLVYYCDEFLTGNHCNKNDRGSIRCVKD